MRRRAYRVIDDDALRADIGMDELRGTVEK